MIGEKPWRQWPLGVDKAADEIIVHFSREVLQEIAGMPEADLLKLWCKYGQLVRNRLSLWQNYKGHEDESPDPDMFSYEILKSVWEKLAKK